MKSSFVYVTYIRTTPGKLWEALTTPEFTRRYWFGTILESDWQVGSPWKMSHPDGRVTDGGEVVEAAPPKRLVLRWRNEMQPALRAEGFTLCTFDIETIGEQTKLTVTHEIEREGSRVIAAVSGGWPMILSSLKSLLETGRPLAPEAG